MTRAAALGSVAMISLVFPASGWAADVSAPVYKAAPAMVQSGGWYVWADGEYERINLPDVALGYHVTVNAAGFPDGGRAVDNINVRLNGWGVRGGIGYYLPPGSFLPGTRQRIEVGGSFVGAKGTGTTGSAVSTFDVSQFTVAGSGQVAFICVGAFNCTTASSLSTDYQAWTAFAKVAWDHVVATNIGTLTITPSLAVVGGSTRNNQTLASAFNQFLTATGVTVDSGAYTAALQTKWEDIGARPGLEYTIQWTPWLSTGSSGYVGFANRHVSLNASDVGTSTPLGIFNNASAIAITADKFVVTANYESGVNITPAPNWTIRGFVGTNFDSAVPGITTPAYTGSVNAPTARTPSTIKWVGETSYYGGAGVSVRF
jgi:hypothetical protein